MMGASLYIRGTRVPLVSIIISLTLLVALTLLRSAPASAASFTWTGGGGDANFSTDANWQGGTAPTGVATDSLTFDNTLSDFDAKSPSNDLVGATFDVLTFQGAEADVIDIVGSGFSVGGGIVTNADIRIDTDMTLTANQTFSGTEHFQHVSGTLDVGSFDLTVTNSKWSYFYSTITGTGNLIFDDGLNLLLSANTYTGTTTMSNGSRAYLYDPTSLGTVAGDTTIGANSFIYLFFSTGEDSIAEPFQIMGSTNATPSIYGANKGLTSGELGSSGSGKAISFTGAISLASDTYVKLFDVDDELNFTSVTKNGFEIIAAKGSSGTIKVNGTTIAAGAIDEQTIATDFTAGSTRIYQNSDHTYTGQRGDVYVEGIFRGTATTEDLFLYNTGKVAPGLSPGCITSNNVTISGGTYEMEIAGTTACTGYDQQVVNGALTINASSVLSVSLLNAFKPATNDVFVLFSNDGNDAVSGTFNGLTEGATVSLDGTSFRISYQGGDGNDVTLTTLSVPAVPDTGSPMTRINPLIPALATITAVGGLLLAKRQLAYRKYISR